MMIAKEAKIWLKCFLQFLHDLICDFFALYLSQYRLNKLFLHNLFLWFSFYVRISYSNSSSPLGSLVYSTVLLPTFISFKAYTYNTIVFSLVILSLVLFFRTIISCNFSFLTFTQIYYIYNVLLWVLFLISCQGYIMPKIELLCHNKRSRRHSLWLL